jgi:prepilin-type N-terminal cleavage/methylation domain-containing protein
VGKLLAKKGEKKMNRLRKNQAGFTILELLVVLVIMGFLLAMIAPRLLGIYEGTEDTICDTNIKEAKKHLAVFEMKNSKLPNSMIVPAYLEPPATGHPGTGDWFGPTRENTALDGKEVFTTEMVERLRLRPHVLRRTEIEEIVRDLGIRDIVVLNNPEDIIPTPGTPKDDIWGNALPAVASPKFTLVTLAGNETALADVMRWPMIGAGDTNGSTTGGWVQHADWNAVYETIADPRWAYRLILGIGPDSELLEAILAAEGKCPSFERAASDDTIWGWYMVVLPRLEATVASLAGSGMHKILPSYADVNEDGAWQSSEQLKLFDLSYTGGAYKRANFDIFCPEGHRYPEEVPRWGIRSTNTTDGYRAF